MNRNQILAVSSVAFAFTVACLVHASSAARLRPPFQDPDGGVIYVGHGEAAYVGWLRDEKEIQSIKNREKGKVFKGLGIDGATLKPPLVKRPIYIEIAKDRSGDVSIFLDNKWQNGQWSGTAGSNVTLSVNHVMKSKESSLVPEPSWDHISNGGVDIWWRPVAMANGRSLFLAVFKAANRTQIEEAAVGHDDYVGPELTFD